MDESASFVDPETGEVQLLTFQELRLEEEDDGRPLDEFPRWKRESVERVRSLDFERLLALSSKRQIHEWAMMRDFAMSQNDRRQHECLKRTAVVVPSSVSARPVDVAVDRV